MNLDQEENTAALSIFAALPLEESPWNPEKQYDPVMQQKLGMLLNNPGTARGTLEELSQAIAGSDSPMAAEGGRLLELLNNPNALVDSGGMQVASGQVARGLMQAHGQLPSDEELKQKRLDEERAKAEASKRVQGGPSDKGLQYLGYWDKDKMESQIRMNLSPAVGARDRNEAIKWIKENAAKKRIRLPDGY